VKEAKAPALSAADLAYLQTGRADLESRGGWECFASGIGHPRNQAQAREAWELVRDVVLRQWVKVYPGTRPWGWWFTDALEPRRALETAAVHQAPYECDWRGTFGVELYEDTADGELIESQAAYLDRLGLLTAPERKRLNAGAMGAGRLVTVDTVPEAPVLPADTLRDGDPQP
jgi:hypothetical protein